jgi:hypothetical protein
MLPPMSATSTPSMGFKGIAPNMFTGDRSRLDAFLNKFHHYKMLNHNNEAMNVPFYRVLPALSYIKGPLIEDWVNAQGETLEKQVFREGVTIPTPLASELERIEREQNRTKGGWRTTRIPFRL